MIVWSLKKLEKKKREYINFTGEWKEAFGTPEKGGCWIVYGKSGHGKTRFSLLLARELERLGNRILYLSMEMVDCEDFVKDLHEAGINSASSKIIPSPGGTVKELDKYLSSQRSPDVVILDSVQYFEKQYKATSSEIIDLRKKYPNKLFIFISHVDGKEVEGKLAYEIKRDSYKRFLVEGFRAIFKGRGKGGIKGYLTIWDKGAEEYWIE